jgi:hypothetical protein
MKRWLWAALALLLSCAPAFAGTIPISGNIQLPSGAKLNGKIRFILSYSAARDTSNNNITVSPIVEFPVINGALPSYAQIVPNDVLQPAHTWYTVQYISALGALVGQNIFYVQGTSFNLGTATPTPVTTSNLSFGLFTGLTTVTTQRLDNLRFCDQFTGSSFSAKALAAINDGPSTGVTADCRGLEGAQTVASDFLAAITKPVDLWLPQGTAALSANLTVPSNVRLHFSPSSKLSNSAFALTINGTIDAGPYQIFSGSQAPILGAVSGSVYAEWWGAIADGSTDSSGSLNRMITSIKTAGPKRVDMQTGTYRVDSWSLTGAFGLTIRGDGDGSAFASSYRTRLLYNGAGNTGVITVGPETNGVRLENFLIDCNAKVAGSTGVWLTNASISGSTVQHVNGDHLGITACVYGWRTGDATGVNNFNNDGCQHCQFSGNTVGYQVDTLNSEWTDFTHSTFLLSSNYHVRATTTAIFGGSDIYFGVLDTGGLAGLSGQFRLDLTSFISEIGTTGPRAKTIDVNAIGAIQPGSSCKVCWFPTYGDANDITINWGADAPLDLTGSTIVGLADYDSRIRSNRIVTSGAVFLPTFDSDIVTDVADPTCAKPQLVGSYNDPADVDYYVVMQGANTYKWKRTSGGALSATITMDGRYKGPIEHNMWIEASPCNYTATSAWHYHIHKSGLSDINSGLSHEGGFNVETRRTNNADFSVAASGVAQAMRYDTAVEDLYSLWDATNHIWTCKFPGKYHFTAYAQLAAAAAGTPGTMGAYKNAALLHFNNGSSNNGAVAWSVGIDFTEWMNEGDTMQFKLTQVSGGALNTASGVTGNYLIVDKVTPLTSLVH